MRARAQMHLRDSVPPERFDALMPNALGMPWGAALGTLSVVMFQTQTYFRQLESVVARWEGASNFSVLQPAVPCPLMTLSMLEVEAMKAAGQKEVCLSNNTRCCMRSTPRCDPTEDVFACETRPQVELLGVSSGSRIAKGSMDTFQGSDTTDAT
jgi:hypothetical protein